MALYTIHACYAVQTVHNASESLKIGIFYDSLIHVFIKCMANSGTIIISYHGSKANFPSILNEILNS